MNLKYYWSKLFKKLRGSSVFQSEIHPTSKIESGSLIVNSKFDKHSFCGYDCQIINCEVGSFCSVSNQVIIGGGMHPMDWVGMSPVFYEGRDSVKAKFSTHKRVDAKKTIVGHDVWIGHSVLIKQGITIGTGAVIGMGSVVTKDVPPYGIVAGNPAKLIRMRFSEMVVEELLRSEWWNYSDEKLSAMAKFFKSPQMFLEQIKK
ncbi:MAG TPA: CatB-related O-acetyltransferase [Flavipsychrobacter sp.]|nr:CatB-related O-acetyltransferase [Flavipsychrobacter sp.]